MNILQDKLDYLLDKYSVSAKAVLKDTATVSVDGVDAPLLSHRAERRFTELKSIVQGGTLKNVSAMRVIRIVEKGRDVFDELYRELDICEFVLGKKIKAVTAMQNDNTLNVIATAEDNIVCTFEIAATLNKGEKPKDKHEITAERGVASDIAVDVQLKQDSLYVFGNENKEYTDVDFELYGLSPEDIAVVRSAFAIALNSTASEMKETDKQLNNIVEKAKISAKTAERQVI